MSDVVFEIGGSAKGAEAAVKHLQREIAQLQTNLHYAHLSANADAQKYVKQLEEVKAAMKAAGDEALAKQADKHAAALEKVREQMERVKAEYAAAKEETDGQAESWNKITGLVRGAFAPVTALVGGYLSLDAVLGAVTAKLERQRELEAEAADVQVGQAILERDYLQNMNVKTPEEREWALKLIRDVSAETSMPQSVLMRAAPVMPSAAGAVDRKDWDEMLAAAASVSPADPTKLEANLAGMFDLANSLQTSDPYEVLGFFNQMAEASRIKDRTKISENFVPAVTAGTLSGVAPGDAAAALGALSGTLADTTGARTATAFSSLVQQLEEYLPELDTYAARRDFIQADPARRDAFLAQASFEDKSVGGIEELLTAGSRTDVQFEKWQAVFTTPEEMAEQARTQRDLIEQTPLQRQARFRQFSQREEEEFLLAHPEMALKDQFREALAEFDQQRAAQSSWWNPTTWSHDLEGRFNRATVAVGTDPVAELTRIVEEQRLSFEMSGRGLSDAEVQQLAQLQRILNSGRRASGMSEAEIEAANGSERPGLFEVDFLEHLSPSEPAPVVPLRPQEGDQAAAGRRDEEMLGALRGIHRELELQRLERNGPLPANAFVTQVG